MQISFNYIFLFYISSTCTFKMIWLYKFGANSKWPYICYIKNILAIHLAIPFCILGLFKLGLFLFCVEDFDFLFSSMRMLGKAATVEEE